MSLRFAARLLAWYDRHRRALPWRDAGGDPWAIWVSEIMLQQTRVEAVRGIYPRFMARYPRPEDFATADDDELLTAWQGLGYYRRARLLRDGARAVVTRHGGAVPDDLEALAALPGIGAYTRGAVGSIAFDAPVVAVDGNVERVLARHRGIRRPVKTGAGKKEVLATAEAILDRARPGDFNQALMELGATVCTPRAPRCEACPVATDCAARAGGLVESLPVMPKRRQMVNVHSKAVLVRRSGRQVVAHRIPEGEINAGQVDLPGPGLLVSHEGGAELEAALLRRFGLPFHLGEEVGTIRHGITYHRIALTTFLATCRGRVRLPLVTAASGDPAIPWTTAARKVFALEELASGT